MAIYKLDIAPQQQGYGGTHGYGLIRQEISGAPSRYRVDVKHNSHTVNLSWFFDKNGYDALVAFYYLWMDEPNYFLMDLIIDRAQLLEYRCYFVGGISVPEVQGNTYRVSAQVEVCAQRRNKTEDEMIVLGVLELLNPLEKLVNTDFPNATENLA